MNTHYINSPLGTIEIIGDENTINAINFINEKKYSESVFSKEVIRCVDELNAYFKGDLLDFTFNFQQNGTDFQQKVWSGLSQIPYGTTLSYLELSRRLGDEKAIRAVGTSNGKNKLAIVVPCHRVIGSDGSLTGYAGGLWRKEWLLNHERKTSGKGGEQLGLF
jgi:methylated-DNA-[protein]-cysteine S-methyltransferase